jgi:hypothetical protein
MAGPLHIDRDGFYDDRALCATLGLKPEQLALARRRGELRYTRRGGRFFYLGSWVRNWLTGDKALTEEVAPCP